VVGSKLLVNALLVGNAGKMTGPLLCYGRLRVVACVPKAQAQLELKPQAAAEGDADLLDHLVVSFH